MLSIVLPMAAAFLQVQPAASASARISGDYYPQMVHLSLTGQKGEMAVAGRAANSESIRAHSWTPWHPPCALLGSSPYRESAVGNASALVPGPLVRL